MKKENLREDLQPYYDEADCCHYIVEYRKENAELKEQLKKKQEIINKTKKIIGEELLTYDNESDECLVGLKLLQILEDKGE